MDNAERLINPAATAEDADAALRPKLLADFVGQPAARANLRVFIDAARGRVLNGPAWAHLGLKPPAGAQATLPLEEKHIDVKASDITIERLALGYVPLG